MPAEFNVTKAVYKLESAQSNLIVKETEYAHKVRYNGPFFFRDVEVQCTIPNGEQWTVGFVQSCDAIKLQHTYASGNYTCWEFPTPISDAVSQSFPYYQIGSPFESKKHQQAGEGKVDIDGPKNKQVVKLSMNDNLSSNVQWWDPVPPNQTNYSVSWPHTLVRIERKQRFSTYLVAHRNVLSSSSSYLMLGLVQWGMDFVIEFDCKRTIGNRFRAKRYGDGHVIRCIRSQKDVGTVKLPLQCFVNKFANDVQKLVGYDATGVVKKPHIIW
jgi:hypothetical protein